MGKYWTIFIISLKDTFHYRNRILSNMVMLLFRVGILVFLYSYAFKYVGGEVNNINFQITIWSIGFYFVLLSLNMRRVSQTIKRDVQTGDVEVLLNKPYNYLLYSILTQFAKGIPNILTTAPAMLLVLIIFIGRPQIAGNMEWFLYFGIIAVLSIVLSFIAYTFIGTIAFWLQDSDAVYWLYDKSVMVLGGAYIPVALFPHSIKLLSEYSPMGAMMFITHAAYPNFNTYALRLISTQVVWIIIMSLALMVLFNFARRKVDINGG